MLCLIHRKGKRKYEGVGPDRASKKPKNRSKMSDKEMKKIKMQQLIQRSEYVFHNGLRHVVPYPFYYETRAKGRWLGRELLEVFSSEFGAHPVEYYKNAIETGNITVNENPVETTYIVRNHDLIQHLVR